MGYKAIKSNGNVKRVLYLKSILWGKSVKLIVEVGKGDRTNRILASIGLPYSKGFTKIRINSDVISEIECVDLEFKLSDYRFFGWKINESGNYIPYGSNDGISGSPTSCIEIHDVDEHISNIEINFLFRRSVTEADIRNVEIAAEYVSVG